MNRAEARRIGTGPVNFESVFATLDAICAVEWYNHTPMKSVQLSIEQLKKWGRA